SVLENAAIAAQARAGSSFHFVRPADRERDLNDQAMAALETVGLADRAERHASDLSHGEKRQLELAIALATKPKLLLLDEPLAGTGHDESASLTALINRLKGDFSIILIEHDMDAVFALADRISVLVYGGIIASGDPGEVRSNPEVRKAYLGDETA
ncbi:MAG: ATP-binding cassette domain-containing protein, partial [Pseudomonadota bacterium]